MLGLTGGIACGKSTVTQRLRTLGAFVADADIAARAVIDLPEVRSALLSRFGPGVFDENGGVDRPALAAAAFQTEQATADLNAITHPAILRLLLDEAGEAEASGKYPLVFIDAALLIESGLYVKCSGVWLVSANVRVRVKRIVERDGVTAKQARQRIARQMSDREKARFATRVIKNNGTVEELLAKVDAAFAEELSRRGV